MRIVFVSDAVYPYFKGGKEKRLYELSTRLAKMGHDVHIYCMKWWDGPEKERTEDGVHLHAISKLYPLYNGDRRSIKEGVMFGLACFRLMRVKFDVIDVDQMPFFPIISSWIVCTLRHRKMHGTWHEALRRSEWVEYMGWKGNIAALIERIIIFLPHTITATSAHTIDLIQSELKRSKRLQLVPPGIDSSGINKVKPLSVNFDVLFVGRLVKDKNAALLVKAMDVLTKQLPETECIIIGTGIEQNNLQKLIKKHGLESNVHLIGNLPNSKDVYAYMKAAKVMVLPSKREGFGMVVLEALACGTPVVTIDSPANASSKLITPGVSGTVVAAKPATLADAIYQWIDSTPEPQNIIRETANYDWKTLATRQAEVYAQ